MLKSLLFASFCLWAVSALPESRIVGGYPADVKDFPYQVSIQYYGVHHCGGSIIGPKVVLTAAHCVEKYDSISTTVCAGTTHLSKPEYRFSIELAYIHPYFNPNDYSNDIGFVVIQDVFPLVQTLQAISLYNGPIPDGATVTLSGWGLTSAEVQQTPDQLRSINLRTINREECRARWEGMFHGNQVCTFVGFGQGSCMGDSGGPLVYNGKQIGIVSFGKPCAIGVPDVFTDVNYFFDMINEILAKHP